MEKKQPKDSELQELMDDLAKEIGYHWEDEQWDEDEDVEEPPESTVPSRESPPTQARRNFFFPLIGVILLFFVGFMWFLGSSQEKSRFPDSSIEEMQKKLTHLESLASRIKGLEEEIKLLKSTVSPTAEQLASLSKEVKNLKNKLTQLETRVSKNSRTPRSGRRGIRKSYHIVKKGDTLHRIAFKYGIPVLELCRINHLSLRSTIYPGQKLLLPPQ